MMNRRRLLGIWLCVILIGCTPAQPATEVPTKPATETQQPSPTTSPTETPVLTETPEIIPITGPSMEVGSAYAYVDGSTLVAVPAGDFLMGANGQNNPEHTVTLGDYWIQSTEVTNQQYDLCVKLGKCTPPAFKDNPAFKHSDHANRPVVGIMFQQAEEYCSFIHGRLPSEAEWEKAARGPDGNIYPWGEDVPSCNLLNYRSCIGKTTNVFLYPRGASYYGALDMAGNVFEWVADWYDARYYLNAPSENPVGPGIGNIKVVRSSGIKSDAKQALLATRWSEDPVNTRPDLGFRCVVDNPTYFAPFCDAPLVYGLGGSANVSSSSENCSEVKINQAPGCTKKLSTTNISFTGPADAEIDTGGCAPTGDPNVFTCSGAGQVSISSGCDVDLVGDPTCPDGYSMDGSACKPPKGGKGGCLPGMEYDADLGCCTARSQSDAAVVTAACPVGSFYVAGQNACTPNPLEGIVSVVQPIVLKSCASGGGGGGGGGGVVVDGCPIPEPGYCDETTGNWDTQLCCCSYGDQCY